MKRFMPILIAVSAGLIYISASATPDQTPLALHLFPQNQQAKEGDPVTWYLTAAGAEPLQYQWKLNGQTIAGGATNTLRILSVKSSDQGIYTCTIKNQFGEILTEPVTLSVDSGTTLAESQKIESSKAPPHSTVQTSAPAQP